MVDAAIDCGVTLIDTADVYGNRGDSELEALERFGEKHGRSPLNVAIAGLAAMPGVASVIAGATNPNRYEPMSPPVSGNYRQQSSPNFDPYSFELNCA